VLGRGLEAWRQADLRVRAPEEIREAPPYALDANAVPAQIAHIHSSLPDLVEPPSFIHL